MTEVNGLQNQLAEKLMGLFEFVLGERLKHYEQEKDKASNEQNTPSIIGMYANANAVISGGVGLAPGPWGMAAALPEVSLIIRNQIAMICDIGRAYGKEKALTKELLAGIFLSAFGSTTLALLTVQGGKVLVKRTSLRAFQKVVSLLAGKVTQQLLKSMISKWLPVIGAAAMAVWSNYSTRQIGKHAVAIFEKTIEYLPEEIVDGEETKLDEQVAASFAEIDQTNLEGKLIYEMLTLKSLINLMKADGHIKIQEREYVKRFMEKVALKGREKVELTASIYSSTSFTIDYTVFANVPEEALTLMLDLVALARRDGKIHPSEKIYIKQVGKLVGFSDKDIEEMLTSD